MRTIAYATTEEGKKLDLLAVLDAKTAEFIQHYEQIDNIREIYMLTAPFTSPAAK